MKELSVTISYQNMNTEHEIWRKLSLSLIKTWTPNTKYEGIISHYLLSKHEHWTQNMKELSVTISYQNMNTEHEIWRNYQSLSLIKTWTPNTKYEGIISISYQNMNTLHENMKELSFTISYQNMNTEHEIWRNYQSLSLIKTWTPNTKYEGIISHYLLSKHEHRTRNMKELSVTISYQNMNTEHEIWRNYQSLSLIKTWTPNTKYEGIISHYLLSKHEHRTRNMKELSVTISYQNMNTEHEIWRNYQSLSLIKTWTPNTKYEGIISHYLLSKHEHRTRNMKELSVTISYQNMNTEHEIWRNYQSLSLIKTWTPNTKYEGIISHYLLSKHEHRTRNMKELSVTISYS